MASAKHPARTRPAAVPRRTRSRTAAAVKELKSSLPDQAYAMIEEAIVTLRIPPGAAVSEQSLSDMTGIGRTPVREAIQRLAREHLIQVLPQRGLLVSAIDVGKQLRLLETRREIERLICRSAARRATPEQKERFAALAAEFKTAATRNDDVAFMRADREFNDLCLAAARNEFAEGAMRMLHGLSRRFWYVHYKQAADMPEMARLHANVAVAIGKGDPEAAMKAHDKLLDNLEGFTRATVMS
ncbi:MAG TPA: GntR family transcriptional regulator [Ramlibacter sp.]|nr:GntR family transcriptional regulator [Ramlibacter sp.]